MVVEFTNHSCPGLISFFFILHHNVELQDGVKCEKERREGGKIIKGNWDTIVWGWPTWWGFPPLWINSTFLRDDWEYEDWCSMCFLWEFSWCLLVVLIYLLEWMQHGSWNFCLFCSQIYHLYLEQCPTHSRQWIWISSKLASTFWFKMAV